MFLYTLNCPEGHTYTIQQGISVCQLSLQLYCASDHFAIHLIVHNNSSNEFQHLMSYYFNFLPEFDAKAKSF